MRRHKTWPGGPGDTTSTPGVRVLCAGPTRFRGRPGQIRPRNCAEALNHDIGVDSCTTPNKAPGQSIRRSLGTAGQSTACRTCPQSPLFGSIDAPSRREIWHSPLRPSEGGASSQMPAFSSVAWHARRRGPRRRLLAHAEDSDDLAQTRVSTRRLPSIPDNPTLETEGPCPNA